MLSCDWLFERPKIVFLTQRTRVGGKKLTLAWTSGCINISYTPMPWYRATLTVYVVRVKTALIFISSFINRTQSFQAKSNKQTEMCFPFQSSSFLSFLFPLSKHGWSNLIRGNWIKSDWLVFDILWRCAVLLKCASSCCVMLQGCAWSVIRQCTEPIRPARLWVASTMTAASPAAPVVSTNAHTHSHFCSHLNTFLRT